jgi:hypothetical protein
VPWKPDAVSKYFDRVRVGAVRQIDVVDRTHAAERAAEVVGRPHPLPGVDVGPHPIAPVRVAGTIEEAFQGEERSEVQWSSLASAPASYGRPFGRSHRGVATPS